MCARSPASTCSSACLSALGADWLGFFAEDFLTPLDAVGAGDALLGFLPSSLARERFAGLANDESARASVPAGVVWAGVVWAGVVSAASDVGCPSNVSTKADLAFLSFLSFLSALSALTFLADGVELSGLSFLPDFSF
ncbi:hypothetical protein C5B85_05805 [Pseudoclavibacter sp. AY1F1]|nr:hypothetical protein C5B85_05805 [Pseudoclavibacter sp. AY1F1]